MAKARYIAGIEHPRNVHFTFNGSRLLAHDGEGLAAALLRAGVDATRRTTKGAPRGYYCGMGLCWDCVVEVEGIGVVRGCQQLVSEGIVVTSATGWNPEDPQDG